MSSIITFYSYKGGVGRSMALANVAILLARRGLRVLAVDWDLEAPGLDQYFSPFRLEASSGGLLQFIIGLSKGEPLDYKQYLSKIAETNGNELWFLPSGREGDEDYTSNLERFDWRAFFMTQGGGASIEDLRRRWRAEFDIVLIDSRTGLADTAGICTIQLPDIVVAMFTANYQSLYGVRDVMRLAQQARQMLAYDRMPLTIFPLPSRFGVSSEFRESQEWIARFEEALSEFYREWLPKRVRPKFVLERIKVPQVDYFGFGEKLAVIEQGTADPHGMGFIYRRVSDILAHDFNDIEGWLGPEVKDEIERSEERPRLTLGEVPPLQSFGYDFDVFVSYAYNSTIAEWLREFIRLLIDWVEQESGKPLKVFFDISEIRLGDRRRDEISRALSKSRLLLVAATPQYFVNGSTLADWLTFERRSQITGAHLVLPMLAAGPGPQDIPEHFQRYQFYDFREYVYIGPGFRESTKYFDFQSRIRDMARHIFKLLPEVPAFSNWPIVVPSEAAVLSLRQFAPSVRQTP